MNKRRNTNGLLIIAILGLLLMFFIFSGPDSNMQTMTYSQVVDYFESGEVDDFTLDMNSGTLEIRCPKVQRRN